jgi:hypothetical protein
VLADQAAQDEFPQDLPGAKISCGDAGKMVLTTGDALVDALDRAGAVL